MKARMALVKEKYAELESSQHQVYQDVAFILNRPFGLIQDSQYRAKIEKKGLKNIMNSMEILEACCGILSLFFGAQVEFPGCSEHPCKASSFRTQPLIKREIDSGITELLYPILANQYNFYWMT
jgi:hypothetical protein